MRTSSFPTRRERGPFSTLRRRARAGGSCQESPLASGSRRTSGALATPCGTAWTPCPTKDGGPTPPDNPQGDGEVTAVETKIATYSGPLPPAVELEAYGRIDGTFPERIVSMAESYAAHQQDLERQAMSQERSDRKWGRGVAAAVVLGVLAACLYALHLG